MKLQPDRVNELFMEAIGMDVENENSELSKSTEEEIHVYDDRDAFMKESCEDELELGLTVSFCEEQETAKERTDDDHKHSSEEEKTKESQSQNTPDVIDITEDENQEPDRESLTCMQNDVEVLSNGNEDTPKLRSEHDEENSSKKGGESDDGNKDNKEDHISVVEDGSNSTSEESGARNECKEQVHGMNASYSLMYRDSTQGYLSYHKLIQHMVFLKAMHVLRVSSICTQTCIRLN